MAGPALRTDVISVYAFRHAQPGVEFLQLRRAPDQFMGSTWQPVMGKIHTGERALDAALRELEEEATLTGPSLIGVWQLEELDIYFMHAWEAVVMSPGFAVQIEPAATVQLSPAHDAWRWTHADAADQAFLWPGQRRAVRAVERDLLAADSTVERWLRVQ